MPVRFRRAWPALLLLTRSRTARARPRERATDIQGTAPCVGSCCAGVSKSLESRCTHAIWAQAAMHVFALLCPPSSGPGPKGRISHRYGSSHHAGFAEPGRQPARDFLNQYGPPEEDFEFAPTHGPSRDVAGTSPTTYGAGRGPCASRQETETGTQLVQRRGFPSPCSVPVSPPVSVGSHRRDFRPQSESINLACVSSRGPRGRGGKRGLARTGLRSSPVAPYSTGGAAPCLLVLHIQ